MRVSVKPIIFLTVILIGAVFLNRYVLKFRMSFYPKPMVSMISYFYIKLEGLGGIIDNIENFNHLARENEDLKNSQKLLVSFKAQVDQLQTENEFLRKAINISQKEKRQVVDASVFNVNLGSDGYNVLLNKGSDEGISEGDVVVTAEGVLVGKIEKTEPSFSKVLFIFDSKFKITARVIGSNTAGIARGAFNEGMYLELVAQDDEIKEGDSLVSSGDDMFPPALVIGRVENIKSNQNELFKKVRIRPTVKDIQIAKVLVIKK